MFGVLVLLKYDPKSSLRLRSCRFTDKLRNLLKACINSRDIYYTIPSKLQSPNNSPITTLKFTFNRTLLKRAEEARVKSLNTVRHNELQKLPSCPP